MLDDATNVHGSYVRVTGITAPDQVIARINHPQQAGYEFAGKGDEIDVVDASKADSRSATGWKTCRGTRN